MERKHHPCPSFLKLLMEEDFRKQIRIPNAFTRDFKNKLPGKCVLKCTAGKMSWPVRICRKGNDFYICRDAWPKFVKDHQLKYGDYVLFWLVKKTTFEVITYGSDSNRKFDVSYDESSSGPDDAESESLQEDDIHGEDEDFDPSNGHSSKKAGAKQPRNVNPGIRVKEESGSSEKEETVDEYDDYYIPNLENPYFVKKLRPSNGQQMAIPAGFAKETKIDFQETLVLHGEDNRQWTVKIWRGSLETRFVMTEGWSSFLRGYQVKMGDRYKFTLLRSLGNVLRVERIRRSN